MVAPPEEARRARADLEQAALLEEALRASEERAEDVQHAWQRLAELQVEQDWEQVAARAAEQVERHRELIAVRAAELAEDEGAEVEDATEPAPAAEQQVLSSEAPLEDDSEGLPADWDAFLARARAAPAEPVEVERLPEVLPPPRRRSRRRPLLIALVAALAVAALAGVGWARDWFRDNQPNASTASAPPSRAPRHPSTSASPPAKPKATPKKKTQKPAAKKRTRTAAARTTPKAPKKPAVFVPARVWSWPAARGSSRYRVRFFRNGTKVLDVRTTKPRLVLAKGFTFQNGRYRWTVVPISSAGKSLRPIVDSTFVVSGQ